MPYVGKKPADIIATAVDTTTGDFSGAVTAGGTLGVTGAVTANAGVVVDEMTLDGDRLTATDTFTIDAVGDIFLDADGGDVILKDNDVEFGRLINDSTDFNIQCATQDKDIKFSGNDGGSGVTALTLDMSAAGNATFNGTVLASNGTNSLPSLSFSGDTNTGLYRPSADNLGFAVGGVARAFMSGTQFAMTGNGRFSGTIIAESGDITISDGNLVVASGHGIDFGATANSGGSMQQELLDDYEEGTWTPVITPETQSAASIDVDYAEYTKVGRLVSVMFQVDITSISGGTNVRAIELSGMPYTASSAIGGGANIGYVDLNAMTGSLAIQFAGTTTFRIVNLNGTTSLNASDHLKAGSILRGMFTYHAV